MHVKSIFPRTCQIIDLIETFYYCLGIDLIYNYALKNKQLSEGLTMDYINVRLTGLAFEDS